MRRLGGFLVASASIPTLLLFGLGCPNSSSAPTPAASTRPADGFDATVLEQRIAALEERLAARDQRIEELARNTLLGDASTLEQRVGALEAQRRKTVLAAFGNAPNFAGTSRYPPAATLGEYPVGKWVAVAANTWTTVNTIPAMGNAELDAFYGFGMAEYAGGDASVSCDGGNCVAAQWRKTVGQYVGGDFCAPGGPCASAGPFDTQEDSFIPTAGVMAGFQVRLSWSAPNILVQVQCSSACNATGSLSRFGMDPPFDAGAPADSGPVDAADAGSDASDASDSGLTPPTLSSIVWQNLPLPDGGTIPVSYGPHEGVFTAQITGTCFSGAGCAGLTSLTFGTGGSSCTPTVTSSTTAYCVVPANTSSATNDGLVNVTANGGSTITNGWCFTPPGALEWFDPDLNVSTSPGVDVYQWEDQISLNGGAGLWWVQDAGSSVEPTLASAFWSNGLPAVSQTGPGFLTTIASDGGNGVPWNSKQLTFYRVWSDTATNAGGTNYSTGVVNSSNSLLRELQSGTSSTVLAQKNGSTYNYGHTSPDIPDGGPRSSPHLYTETYDNSTVDGGLAVTQWVDAIQVALTVDSTSALNNVNFATLPLTLFAYADGTDKIGTTARQGGFFAFNAPHSAAQIANMLVCLTQGGPGGVGEYAGVIP